MVGIQLYRPSLRAWGAIAVLAAWAGSLAWLGARQLGQSESSTITSQASLRLAPGAAWFALYAGGTQVGSAGITLDTLSPGYRILHSVTLELPADTGMVRATRRTETRLAGTLEMQSVGSQYSREGRQTEWELVRHGDTLAARYLDGRVTTAGSARFDTPIAPIAGFSYRLALAGALSRDNRRTQTLVGGWPPVIRSSVMLVGKDSVIAFADSSITDPATGRQVPARIDSVRAWPVEFDGPMGPERLWVDVRGEIAARETVFGFRWERSDFDMAVREFRARLAEVAPAIRLALPHLVTLASQRSADTDTVERRYRVEHRDGRPIDRRLLALLGGGRQAIHGDTILVRAEPFATQQGGFDELSSDPMSQERAPEVVSLAGRVCSTGATRAALSLLATTLRRQVRVDSSSSAPIDARGALRAKRAHPDGLVRLYVAVLRSCGIPARMVVGVAPAGDSLRTHAWVEVQERGGKGWLAVDPVFGRVPASTSLIRIARGGSSDPEEMLALLADVKFIDLGRSELLP